MAAGSCAATVRPRRQAEKAVAYAGPKFRLLVRRPDRAAGRGRPGPRRSGIGDRPGRGQPGPRTTGPGTVGRGRPGPRRSGGDDGRRRLRTYLARPRAE